VPGSKEAINEVQDHLSHALFDAQVFQTAGSQVSEAVELLPLLNELCKEFRSLANHQNTSLTLKAALQSTCHVKGVRSDIHVALSNLVDNAIKYSRPGTEVRIGVKILTDLYAAVEIVNVGQAFPLKEWDTVVASEGQTRFHNGCSRVRTGLGLLQAKQLLEKNDAFIEIETKPMDGPATTDSASLTVVRATLPKYEAIR